MAKIPNTKVRTGHAVAIRVRGVTIGFITSWAYNLNRDISAVYELNPQTSGEPVENVPGNVTNLTISVQRADLYISKMEEAFGGQDISMLSDQSIPFEVYEVWNNPDGTREMYVYTDCWFSRIGRRIESTGDRVVRADAEITYVRRVKVSS